LGRLRAHGKKKRPLALVACGLKGCWAGGRKEKEREREREKEFPFSFKISFQIHFLNIQTSIKQKSMHSNHDAQTLIISKLF
jgi:hypothetical protein